VRDAPEGRHHPHGRRVWLGPLNLITTEDTENHREFSLCVTPCPLWLKPLT
jgi:hypothetical protein